MTGWRATLLVTLVTGLVAALARLPWLASSPPGFSLAEARVTLAARDLAVGDLLHPHSGSLDSQQPLFSALVWLTGSLAGFEVTGPRLAAALLGIVAAIGCALWHRHALGSWAGIVGGLLAGTAFPWLVLSRQARPAIGAAAFAALGLWCLWESLGPRGPDRDPSARRGWWAIAAGILFGLGVDSHPALLPALIVAPAGAAFLIWRGADNRRNTPGYGWLIAAAACLLLVASPVIVDSLSGSGAIRQRLEQDWNGDGQVERLREPFAAISGYGETLRVIGWSGHGAATLGTPGRPLLDPLLLIWMLAGLAVVIARPLAPLHGLAIVWLIGFGAIPALLDPGNSALLMPLTPVLFLLPPLGLLAGWELVRERGRLITRFGIALATVSVIGSAGWSLFGYVEWTRSDTTYVAFHAGLREALAAVDRLTPGTSPVYVATNPVSTGPLLDIFGPSGPEQGPSHSSDRTQRAIGNQSTLVVPAGGVGYLVTTASDPLSPGLQQYLDGQTPVQTGTTPEGAPAWQTWTVGQPVRDRLPWTLPVFRFPDGFELAGFDIHPDLGDVATTGQLPDPPRVLVTLVWNIPRGATPHIARVRLLPVDPAAGVPDQSATSATTILTASPPIEAGNRGREIVVVELSVPVPESPDLIVEVQAGLSRGDGGILPPIDAGADAAGDYVRLNRVQYVRDSDASP